MTLARYDAVPGITSPGFFSPGDLGLPFPEPAPVELPYFSAVPGLAIPGMFTIAFEADSGLSYYQYIGHLVLYYLDYIDEQTLRTLKAYPGNIYAMFPVSSRHGLSEPPPDGRWGLPSAPSYEVIWVPEIRIEEIPREVLEMEAHWEAEDMLSRAKIRNISLQLVNARKPYRQSPYTGKIEIREKEILPLSESDAALANARKRNAELQARMARGEKIGC